MSLKLQCSKLWHCLQNNLNINFSTRLQYIDSLRLNSVGMIRAKVITESHLYTDLTKLK